VGGLSCLAIAISSIDTLGRQKAKPVAEMLRRFSSIAIICVGSIGITGIYNLLVEVGSLSALLDTPYGRILLVKLAIFAPMIAFGAMNQFIIYDHLMNAKPRSKRTNPQIVARWLRRFGSSIRTEMALGIILLIVVGILTASAPAVQTQGSAPTYQPTPFIVRGYSIQGVNVTLKIFPFQVGANHFDIDFTNPQGSPITDVRSVFMRFTYLDKNLGVVIANATGSQNAGEYSFDGTYLSFSGNWRAEIWAQRSGAFDVIVPFQLSVPSISLRISELPLSTDANPYGIAIDPQGVVWFAETGSSKLARYEPTTGTFTEFSLPQGGSRPFYITLDQEGSIWASETQYNQIVRFDPLANTFKQYPLPTSGAVPGGIAVDKGGNIWFTEEIAGKIGKLDPLTGLITEFTIPTADAIPIQIVTDSHGSVWFTESKGGRIGSVDTQRGVITEFQPKNGTLLGPTGITSSPDGSVWFTEHAGNRITRFDPNNETFQSFTIPTAQAFPFGITYHANRLWFVEHIANAIGNLDLATGIFSNFPIPNNSSDVQLLAVDTAENVWFTLPASNALGVLTPTNSTLQIVSTSNNSGFIQLALVAAVVVGTASVVAFIFGRRRMKRKAGLR
jgi:streptogramin lyase